MIATLKPLSWRRDHVLIGDTLLCDQWRIFGQSPLNPNRSKRPSLYLRRWHNSDPGPLHKHFCVQLSVTLRGTIIEDIESIDSVRGEMLPERTEVSRWRFRFGFFRHRIRLRDGEKAWTLCLACSLPLPKGKAKR